MSEHSLSAGPTHSRWNRNLEPRLEIASGDTVHMECVDASDGQVRPGMTVDEYLTIDRGRIHALTGPIAIQNAEPGDTLEVEILDVQHKGWGWTSIIAGLGFLKDRFKDPFLFHWELEPGVTRSLAPAIVSLRPFCGVMGVAPAEDGEFRTRAPGSFGGNMDVRDLTAGSKVYLPVLNAGALFSAGDAHAAQGDGEICINGIECPADVTLRFHLHKHRSISGPLIASGNARPCSGGEWIVVESAADALTAARTATSRMVDLLSSHWGFTPEHAYLLCSVAMDLRLSQVVNEPMTTVTAAIAKTVLPERSLF
ncbi:acetamidase/formamidase [Silvibacterium bohemicum]|uniref:Acetamidase/formamidase n=1 Tax=Silvibacterium bohemicum TaxID=1577686 RepID=A0A841JT09_9BACT|nr:acetamidase/formamidase family protein [Silvibacterium bohemicum]MBB6142081.1 acetamidase/formamidase [Silvibacterium bohemicum]